MPAPSDLVHQTTISTGTGALTISAENGKRTFLTAFGTGGTDTFDYFVSNRDAAEWERGTGHENAGTLVRDTVIASSNANAAVNFSAGTKDVTNDIPAGVQARYIPAGSTDNSVVRRDGTTGALLQDSPLLIGDTDGSLSRSGNGGIPVQGTNTNDNAAAGYVGEVIESNIGSGSAVSLTTGTGANVTSLSLTAGDWDVWGNVFFQPGGATTITALSAAINTTSASLGDVVQGGGAQGMLASFATGFPNTISAGRRRISIASTTTVYLVAQANFGASTLTAYGYIGARRAR